MLINFFYCMVVGISALIFDFSYCEAKLLDTYYDEYVLTIKGTDINQIEKVGENIEMFHPEFIKEIESIKQKDSIVYLLETFHGDKYKDKLNIFIEYVCSINNCKFELRTLDKCDHNKISPFITSAYSIFIIIISTVIRLLNVKKVNIFYLIFIYIGITVIILFLIKTIENNTRVIEVSNPYNISDSERIYQSSLAIYLIKLLLVYAVDFIATILLG